MKLFYSYTVTLTLVIPSRVAPLFFKVVLPGSITLVPPLFFKVVLPGNITLVLIPCGIRELPSGSWWRLPENSSYALERQP